MQIICDPSVCPVIKKSHQKKRNKLSEAENTQLPIQKVGQLLTTANSACPFTQTVKSLILLFGFAFAKLLPFLSVKWRQFNSSDKPFA